MEFNFAYNKPNSFFKEKKAITLRELVNGADEKICSGSEVTIICKSRELKVYFDVVSKDRIHVYRVSHEDLELVK
ncbi:hypothetical protein ACI6PS_02410 [Flavobacterium sp. PLA-1-15]|uniref:hypothetical protein n=1 Tax=Flavobacterium sp. PLA-1-15 TaxID=3380533 RepID=UPI003B75E200